MLAIRSIRFVALTSHVRNLGSRISKKNTDFSLQIKIYSPYSQVTDSKKWGNGGAYP